jgi:site-specific DNA-methyltransferase (adenine-specific)
MIASMRRFLKESDVMAYLVMMTNRLLELHRVLKTTVPFICIVIQQQAII